LSDAAVRYARPLFGFPPLVSQLKSFARLRGSLRGRRSPELSAGSTLTAGERECIFILVNQFLLAPPVLSTLCGAFFCQRNRAGSDAIAVSHRAKKSFRLSLAI